MSVPCGLTPYFAACVLLKLLLTAYSCNMCFQDIRLRDASRSQSFGIRIHSDFFSSCSHTHTKCSREQVRHIHRHLINLRRIVKLNIAQNAHVFARHEVDRYSFASKATRSANAVNVVLSV